MMNLNFEKESASIGIAEFVDDEELNLFINTKGQQFKRYIRQHLGDRLYLLLEEFSKEVEIFSNCPIA